MDLIEVMKLLLLFILKLLAQVFNKGKEAVLEELVDIGANALFKSQEVGVIVLQQDIICKDDDINDIEQEDIEDKQDDEGYRRWCHPQ